MSNKPKIDTGVARLPAIPRGAGVDPQMSRFMEAVAERLEVREGARGNKAERNVTQRELDAALQGLDALNTALKSQKVAKDGEVLVHIGPGFTASVAVDQFAQGVLGSRLFRELNKTLDDPSRFDHMPQEVRDVLSRSLIDEAAQRRASIEDSDQVFQTALQSLSMRVQQLTSSLGQANSGIRLTNATYSDGMRAVSYVVQQLQSSLGNYYQDGRPGRVGLESQMETMADYSQGLRAQYTLKVQAGGALAGFGIAAEEPVGEKASSAFIIQADKFAIVSPSYTGGMLKTPRPEDMVFGVDSQGIYLQNNVYVKGGLRVDGGGKTLLDGLRGSLQISVSGYAWSDTSARQGIWAALGKSGSAPDSNHLVIGDMVTVSNFSGYAVTRHWNGYAWADPGVVFNGDLIVDNTIAARKINTNGLTVRDNYGNIILSSNGISASWVNGLGSMAKENAARIGSNVMFPDGSIMGVADFISRLSKISSNNISNFMDVAAIGTAFIGNAAVGTLQIAGNAVTVPVAQTAASSIRGAGYWQEAVITHLYLDSPGYIFASCGGYVSYGTGWTAVQVQLQVDGYMLAGLTGDEGLITASMSGSVWVPAGLHSVRLIFLSDSKAALNFANVFAMGVKR